MAVTLGISGLFTKWIHEGSSFINALIMDISNVSFWQVPLNIIGFLYVC